MKGVTQVVPTGMQKQIKRNETLFGKRIKQLSHILADESYIPNGSTDSYHEFILSMYKALINGRRITPKMESSITKIVKSYAKTLNPEYKKKRLKYIENTLDKLNSIRILLHEAKYTKSYERSSEYFLDSIQNQVTKRGSLSMKQRKAVNKMYLQFKKRIRKGTLSVKEPWHKNGSKGTII